MLDRTTVFFYWELKVLLQPLMEKCSSRLFVDKTVEDVASVTIMVPWLRHSAVGILLLTTTCDFKILGLFILSPAESG